MSALLDGIAGLPPWLLLVVVFALPAAEAGILIGVFVPGETAVLLGGVAASQGALPLWPVVVAAVVGAVLGDQVGFLLGRRYGDVLVEKVPARLWKPEHIEQSKDFLRRRGAFAVILGRWTAALRALVPGIAGLSGMRHRTFSAANAVGGATWGAVVAVGGYLAGSSYKELESTFGTYGGLLTGAVVLAVVVVVVVRRLRARRRESAGGNGDRGATADVDVDAPSDAPSRAPRVTG